MDTFNINILKLTSRMNNRFFAYVLCFLNISCIQQFDYENKTEKKFLVVEGGITQKNIIHELTLSFSTSFGDIRREPADGAEIILYDDHGNQEAYVSLEGGKYLLYGTVVERKPGTAYYIKIRWSQGKTFHSIPQIMPDMISPDSLHYKVERISEINDNGNVVEINYINILLDTPINKFGRNNYFIWRSDHVYSLTEVKWHPLVDPKVCYVKQSSVADQVYIFSSENIEEDMLTDFLVSKVIINPYWQFFEKHFYNVTQYSITKEAYVYWETVNKIAYPTGSIFDTPPAPIKGNIYNIYDPDEVVLGFFEVSAIDTIRTRTSRHDLKPLAIEDRCNDEYLYKSWNDQACHNCLVLENASAERPYYWGQ